MPLSSCHATTASVERNRSRGRPRSFGERAPALVLPRGRRLHDGDPGDSMLVVTGGHFARRLTTRAGRECMFRVYSPGDVFGRIAVAPLEVSGAARRGAARRPPGSTVDHLPRRRTSWCRSTRTRSLARAPMQRRQDASRPIHRSRLVRTVTVHVPVGDNFTPRSHHAASGGDGAQLALPERFLQLVAPRSSKTMSEPTTGSLTVPDTRTSPRPANRRRRQRLAAHCTSRPFTRRKRPAPPHAGR